MGYEFDDSIDELECNVVIHAAANLPPPKKYDADNMSPHFRVTFPYPKDEEQVKETPSYEGASPEILWSHKFAIKRKRSFKNAVDRRRIRVDVLQSRFLRSDIDV